MRKEFDYMNYQEFLKKVTDKLSRIIDGADFTCPNGGGWAKGFYVGGWTSGFYGGVLWYMYRYTKDEKYLTLAKKCSEYYDVLLTEYTSLSHDVGFQFLLTNVADKNITGDEQAKIRALHAANILAGRFNPVGKFIRAWNDNVSIDGEAPKTGYVIIDCMMNIPLLYWAFEETGDPRYRHIADMHADTAMMNFIREDGSSDHIVNFNPETGEVVSRPAGQGYSEGSAWTRGQSWALYGFSMAYRYTKNEKYLETAKKSAKYFISQMNDEYIPIDFMQPAEPVRQDTSAAAISACGLLELSKFVSEDEKKCYASAIERLMNILQKNCDFTSDTSVLLKNGSLMYTAGIHTSLVYGDFYMLEALMRICENDTCLFYTENKSCG